MSLTLGLLCLVAQASPAPPAPAPAVHVIDEKERVALQQMDEVRLSLPTQSDVDAWAGPGLRVQLGYGSGNVFGAGPAMSFSSRSVMLRPSVRLDDHWAVGVTMMYGTGPHGVRWSVTAEPTFMPWRQLALSVGLGYGGLSISRSSAASGQVNGADELVSRDLTGGESLPGCTGSALSSVFRAEYLFVVGPLFATGPFAQLQAQWTRCQATFGTDNETGRPITLTQWWRQGAATLGWWLAWR